MAEAYVSPFYAISISTLPEDADCEMSCLFATSHGPLVDYDCFVRRDIDASVDVHSLFAFPSDAEPLVGVWARCIALMPLRQMPPGRKVAGTGPLSFVSVSVHECPGPDELDRSRLVEHMVAYRQGTKLLVEFANETENVERVGAARPAYDSPWELALDAAGALLWGSSRLGAAPPAPRLVVGDAPGQGSGHAAG